MRVRIDLRLPGELVERVDAARGGQARTAWIVAALEQALGGGEKEAALGKPADPAPVGSVEPARSAAPARAPVARPASVEEIAGTPIPKIARRHWAR